MWDVWHFIGCQFNFGEIEFASEKVTAFISEVSGRIR